ncbi:MAG: hypothetical protein JKX85_05695, partial [Phycisphaeraceae bacterium]|nr:hypothetical protein [Phycisphaeraceae bacterium]
ELVWGNKLNERKLTQQAATSNAQPYAYVYYPNGLQDRSKLLKETQSPIRIEPANLQIVALKKAHNEDSLVVRLQELDGKTTAGKLHLAGSQSINVSLEPYTLKTLLISRKGKKITVRECNLVEGI